MRTIRGPTRRDRNLKARPRSQRTPVSCSQSGRIVFSAAEASGLSRCSAVPCAPCAFTPRSLPTLPPTPRPPAGLPGRTPAGTHPLPRLGDRASGCRPLRPCPAVSAPERSGKSADCPVPMSLEVLPTSREDGDFFFPIKYFMTQRGT